MRTWLTEFQYFSNRQPGPPNAPAYDNIIMKFSLGTVLSPSVCKKNERKKASSRGMCGRLKLKYANSGM